MDLKRHPAVHGQLNATKDGTRLIVYLSDTVTAQPGKFALDCTTASGGTLKIPLFVLDPNA